MNKLIGIFGLTVSVMVLYLWVNQPKPLATVDIKGITDEFLQLTSHTKLQSEQMDALVQEFATALETGVEQLSKDYVLLAKRAVVSDEHDLTDELRDYIAHEITRDKEK